MPEIGLYVPKKVDFLFGNLYQEVLFRAEGGFTATPNPDLARAT